jgi:MFS family permease
MTWERARAGLIGGLAGIALLGAVAIAIKLAGGSVSSLATVALLASVILAGGLSGFLAGQGRRRRSEAKAAVGGVAGLIAGAIVCCGTAAAYVIRYLRTPEPLRSLIYNESPLQIAGAILFLGALTIVIAMIVAHMTARPLPPRPDRRFTRPVPGAPLRMQQPSR